MAPNQITFQPVEAHNFQQISSSAMCFLLLCLPTNICHGTTTHMMRVSRNVHVQNGNTLCFAPTRPRLREYGKSHACRQKISSLDGGAQWPRHFSTLLPLYVGYRDNQNSSVENGLFLHLMPACNTRVFNRACIPLGDGLSTSVHSKCYRIRHHVEDQERPRSGKAKLHAAAAPCDDMTTLCYAIPDDSTRLNELRFRTPTRHNDDDRLKRRLALKC